MLLYDVYTCVGEGIINLWLILSIYNYHFYGTGADTALESLEIWLTLSFIVVCLALLIVEYIPRFLINL
jgi:type IV secretory pathway TrbL component